MSEREAASFGDVLRELRLAAGLSQEALAERARMSPGGVSVLERGIRRAPYRETVSLLAEGLGLSDADRTRLEAAAFRPPLPRRRRTTALDTDAEAGSHNLPLSLTSFVGREADVSEIADASTRIPLVAIVGPGGVGKTRIASEIGRRLLEHFDGGVWFVDLASLAEGSLVARAILRALGLDEPRGRTPLAALTAFLRRRSLLLILDNCEHVLNEASLVAEEIARSCEGVRILATSREPLKIAGEKVYRLQPLPSAAAIELFKDRAQSIDHRFDLTEENSIAVAEICRRLDGIPLAIELAAARIAVLSPVAILERLDRRLSVLSGNRKMLPRQQTLRALIDWSYDLLTPEEQQLFARLSVFSGGCTLAAATLVCGEDEPDEPGMLDMLASLVDKSLVVADLDGDEPRYMLLESTREYAAEKLRETSNYQRIAHRHARTFFEMAERIEYAWDTIRDVAWPAQIAAEQENWRAALEWTLNRRGDVILGQRLAGVLRPIWVIGLGLAEGRYWVHLAFDAIDEETPADVIAQLEFAEALIAHQFADSVAAVRIGQRALERYRALGDDRRVAGIECVVGEAMLYVGRRSEAEPMLREAIDTARRLGTRWLVASLLAILAHARSLEGEGTESRAYYAEAIAIFRAVGDDRGVSLASANLAEAEFLSGDREAAIRIGESGLVAYHRVDVHALANMSAYLIALDRFEPALLYGREAVQIGRERELGVSLMWSLQHVAAVAALRPSAENTVHEAQRAARLVGFIDARLKSYEVPRQFTEAQEYDRVLNALRAVLDSKDIAQQISLGAEMSDDQATDEALAFQV